MITTKSYSTHLYDDDPFNEEVASVVFSHLDELRRRCESAIQGGRIQLFSFDDLFHDAICATVRSKMLSSDSSDSEVLARFVQYFKNIAATIDIRERNALRNSVDASESADSLLDD